MVGVYHPKFFGGSIQKVLIKAWSSYPLDIGVFCLETFVIDDNRLTGVRPARHILTSLGKMLRSGMNNLFQCVESESCLLTSFISFPHQRKRDLPIINGSSRSCSSIWLMKSGLYDKHLMAFDAMTANLVIVYHRMLSSRHYPVVSMVSEPEKEHAFNGDMNITLSPYSCGGRNFASGWAFFPDENLIRSWAMGVACIVGAMILRPIF